jgi:hypothetical protein
MNRAENILPHLQSWLRIFLCASILSYVVIWFRLGKAFKLYPGNTKGGSIAVPLTSCLTGLELAV